MQHERSSSTYLFEKHHISVQLLLAKWKCRETSNFGNIVPGKGNNSDVIATQIGLDDNQGPEVRHRKGPRWKTHPTGWEEMGKCYWSISKKGGALGQPHPSPQLPHFPPCTTPVHPQAFPLYPPALIHLHLTPTPCTPPVPHSTPCTSPAPHTPCTTLDYTEWSLTLCFFVFCPLLGMSISFSCCLGWIRSPLFQSGDTVHQKLNK